MFFKFQLLNHKLYSVLNIFKCMLGLYYEKMYHYLLELYNVLKCTSSYL